MPKITFSNRNNEFYQSLKTAVDEYFEKNRIKKTGDWRLFSKTINLISAAVTQVVNQVKDHGHDISSIVSNQLFQPNKHVGNGLLYGFRSPKYQKDGLTNPKIKFDNLSCSASR